MPRTRAALVEHSDSSVHAPIQSTCSIIITPRSIVPNRTDRRELSESMRQAWYSQLKGLAKEASGYALKGEVCACVHSV